MYFCGNPVLTSRPRQVSPVFQLLTIAAQMEQVCKFVHVLQDLFAPLGDQGEECATDAGILIYAGRCQASFWYRRWTSLRLSPQLPSSSRKNGRFQGIHPSDATSSNPFSMGNVSTICRRNAGVSRILPSMTISQAIQLRTPEKPGLSPADIPESCRKATSRSTCSNFVSACKSTIQL